MTQTHVEEQLDLRQYLSVLRRRKLVIAAVTLLVVAAAVVASILQTPVYEATAEVLLQERASEQILTPDRNQIVQQNQARVETAIGVMQSRSVVEAVEEALLEADPPIAIDGELRVEDLPITIAAQGQTDVVRIAVEDFAPEQAARIANTYATTYIEVRRELLVDDLLGAAERVQERLNALDVQITALDLPIVALDQRIAEAGPAESQQLQGERDLAVERAAAERQPLLAQRTAYAQQLDQLQLAGSIQTGGAQVVSRAQAPDEPIRPTPARNGALALLLGLLLGVGVAFLMEHLDDTVKDKDDLERSTEGLTALALVPTVATWKDRSKPYVVSLREPASPAAETYRSLRTSVQFLGLDKPLRLIQLTSANPGEGKSTTLANLAVALGRAGQRVVVVCCDLRRPRIHQFFELDNSVGFTSVLLGERSLSEALQPVPGATGVSLLASGPPPPNPSELLSSSRAREVFGLLAAQYDVVLIDTPPVLPVTDGLIVSSLVDATILVATAKRSTQKDTHRAMELLRQVEAPLVGSVLNGVESEALYGYGGYGSYSLKATANETEVKGARTADVRAPVQETASRERATPYPGSAR